MAADGEGDDVLQADAEICRLLRGESFAGSLWTECARLLAQHGCNVMKSWLRSGLIAKKCKAQNRPVGQLPSTWTEDDRLELTLETVARALAVFRLSLADGRWTPDRRTTLRTYFIGTCVLMFPNVLRSWRREQERWTRSSRVLERQFDPEEFAGAMEPVDLVDARAALESVISEESERTKDVFRLCFDDHTPAEIAADLGMTANAVNAILHRGRKKLRQDRGIAP